MPLALPLLEVTRPKLPVVRAERSSVLTPAPPPPLMLPARLPALATWNWSAPVPPTSEAMPEKFVVPTPSFTVPAPPPVMA